MGSTMKSRILSILPNRWNESGDIRVMLWSLILMVGASALESTYGLTEANAFLLSGLAAILAVYWIPPFPEEGYVRWILTNSVLLIGGCLFLYKIPSLFASLISYRAAQYLCISVYFICCWFLIRLKEKKFIPNQTH